MAWCKENPNDPLSAYFIKNWKESTVRKRVEKKRWSEIGKAVEHYELRLDRSQVKRLHRHLSCGDIMAFQNRKARIVMIGYDRKMGAIMEIKFEDGSEITLTDSESLAVIIGESK